MAIVNRNDLVKEVKMKLDASGASISSAVIRLVLDSALEVQKDALSRGDWIEFEGLYSARVKSRRYRDSAGRGSMETMKVEAIIDRNFKEELLLLKNMDK